MKKLKHKHTWDAFGIDEEVEKALGKVKPGHKKKNPGQLRKLNDERRRRLSEEFTENFEIMEPALSLIIP